MSTSQYKVVLPFAVNRIAKIFAKVSSRAEQDFKHFKGLRITSLKILDDKGITGVIIKKAEWYIPQSYIYIIRPLQTCVKNTILYILIQRRRPCMNNKFTCCVLWKISPCCLRCVHLPTCTGVRLVSLLSRIILCCKIWYHYAYAIVI